MARGILWVLVVVSIPVAILEVAVRGLDLFEAERRRALAPTAEEPRTEDGAAALSSLHPFLGWARPPGALWWPLLREGPIPKFEDGPSEWTKRSSRANRQGFLSAIEDYTALSRERYVVAVTGGSVADELAVVGGDALRRELAATTGRAAESIDVVNLSAGAYKQPQQLLSVVQALLLGVPIDLVVNVDGFNEIAFGVQDALRGEHPFLPSRGHYRAVVALASREPTRAMLERSLAILRHRESAARWTRRVASSRVLSSSELVKAAVGAWSARGKALALEGERELRALKEGAALRNLPAPCLRQGDGCWDLVGDLWLRASVLTEAVARRSGARYLHFLQPNQYVEGTKPLSDDERRHALLRSPLAAIVREGYARMADWAPRLRAQGVEFHDLRDVFQGRTETLYRDTCCHFNERGTAILAAEIAHVVAKSEGGAGTRERPTP